MHYLLRYDAIEERLNANVLFTILTSSTPIIVNTSSGVFIFLSTTNAAIIYGITISSGVIYSSIISSVGTTFNNNIEFTMSNGKFKISTSLTSNIRAVLIS